MFDPKAIDEIVSRLSNSMHPGLTHIKEDMDKNFHVILQSVLGKLDLVTREEFEVQKLLLAKCRAKLDDLEKRISAIESHGQQAPTADTSESESHDTPQN
ncbi:MAG: accessory factor UbiK family protein [Methylovulum sp.]|nr:accessory factor UbiK family protein [Methylovulum sp.]TSA41258.1 MAG: accessory factor UbiK family protein [Methylococcaceae bacterium]